MPELLTRGFRLNITAPIGVLTEPKVKALQERLQELFPIVAGFDDQNAIFANPEKQQVLVVLPQQLTFGVDGSDIGGLIDFDIMQETFSRAFEALLLERKGVHTTQIMGTYDANGTSMDCSFALLRDKRENLAQGISGLKGVGLRFLIDHGDDVWEYKLEPFIKDPKFYFAEALCAVKQEMSLEEIIVTSKQVYTYYTGDWRKVTVEYLLR